MNEKFPTDNRNRSRSSHVQINRLKSIKHWDIERYYNGVVCCMEGKMLLCIFHHPYPNHGRVFIMKIKLPSMSRKELTFWFLCLASVRPIMLGLTGSFLFFLLRMYLFYYVARMSAHVHCRESRRLHLSVLPPFKQNQISCEGIFSRNFWTHITIIN